MKRILLSLNASLQNLALVEKAGFDCIEPSNTDIMKMTALEFQQAADALKDSLVQCHVIDNPIPCSVSFSSPDWDLRKWETYLQLSAVRAKMLGASYWCFGNGSSRNLPDDDDGKVRTMLNYYEAVARCADVGKAYGITTIVEPLGPSVTNYLTNLPETVAFVKELDRTNVCTMVDYRWEYEQSRPNSDLYKYAAYIQHAHIDNPGTDYKNLKVRRVQSLDDGFDYTEFLDFIKSDSFHGIVSIEANSFTDYEKEISEVLDFYSHYGIEPFRKA